MSGAVTVALGKGGVGKTTTAVNLTDRLAAMGFDAVLVDADQQGHATEAVGRAEAYTETPHLGHVFDGDDPTDVHDLLVDADGGEFDVVPAHEDLDEVASEMKEAAFGRMRVRNKVVDPLLETHDWVVIDSPPEIGPLSDAAIIATQNAVIPMLMAEGSVSGLDRLVKQQLKPIREEIGVDIVSIVPNCLSGDNEEKRIIGDLEGGPFEEHLPDFARSEHFEDPKSPGPGIRKRAALKRSVRDGVPLSAYDPENDMIERYDQLAEMVCEGVGDRA